MLALLFATWLVVTSSAAYAQMGVEDFLVGSNPYGVGFDGTSIWVTNFGSNSVTRMRASDGACVVNGIVQPNLSACTFNVESEPIAVAFDGAYVWVANYASASVTQLRARDGACNGVVNPPTATACSIPVATNPRFLVSDGANIWVAIQGGTSVYKIQASTGIVLGRFGVGSMPSGLAFDGTNIWVANYLSNAVTQLRANDGSVVGTFSVPSPHGLAFDGSNIWVTNDVANGTVTKLRAYDGACVSPCTFNVGSNPIGAAFDGNNIWVTNYSSSTVSELRASNGALVGTFNVVANPAGITVDGTNVWVANTGSSQVTEFVPPPSVADTYIWATGDWSCDVNRNYPTPCWSLNYLPGSNPPHYDDCVIPTSYNVRTDVGGFCNDITVGAGATVAMNPGYLYLNGARINNAGTITNESFNGLELVAPMTFLSGGGTIIMNPIPTQPPGISSIRGNGTNTLVNADNTIQGQGQIGVAGLNLINQKTIAASSGTLSLFGTYMTNAGMMQASSGGVLEISSPAGYQINNILGTISALDRGTVILAGGTINGGTLFTSGSGVIETIGPAANITLNNVTNAGGYINNANTTLQGTVTNNGALYAPNGGLQISGTATLKGTGIVSGDTMANVIYPFIGSITGVSGGLLVNRSTITGGGRIGDNGLTINNQGTINANNPSAHLIFSGLPAINSGLMQASGGATLELETKLNNNGGTVTAQSGSFVLLAQYGNLGPNMVSGGTLVVDGTLTGALSAAGGQQLGLQPGMTLRGQGTIVGDVTSSGTVIAGDSVMAPATLTIAGNYLQSSSGVLDIALGQCSPLLPCRMPPPPQSQLAISKVANLSGTLNISLLDSANFVASVGNTFTILAASAVNGKFTAVNGVHINSNEHFAIVYGQTAVTLVVVSGP
jgi:hypothetical protein